MTPEMQLRYVNSDGSLSEAGYALLEEMARRLEAAEQELAEVKQTLTDNGIT